MSQSFVRRGWQAAGLIAVGAALSCQIGENTPSYGLFNKEVMVVDEKFTPTVTKIITGVRVRWIWDAKEMHNVTWRDGEGGEEGNSFTQSEGDYIRLFDTVGEFTYRCTIHPGMTGTVVVDAPGIPGPPTQ